LANLGLFPRNFVSCFSEERRRCVPSIQSSQVVQPARGHLHTGVVCSHGGRLRRLLGQMPRQFQK
jgi:hypothetical protein